MSGKKDLDKNTLYEAVKTLIESKHQHIHLSQPKLFTLFSIAFQYILFLSTKKPGHYIIRIEDSLLADKLARKAKDETTRKFMGKLIIPRRLNYGSSTFHLDYFALSTWSVTKDLPKEKIQGAIIVKNTSQNPLIEETDFRYLGQLSEAKDEAQNQLSRELFGKHYYLDTLKSVSPNTITIAFGEEYEDLSPVLFDFIEEETERTVEGVTLSKDVKTYFNDDE